MFNRPLKQTEAAARAELIFVDSYDISLDLSGCGTGATTFDSHTVARFRCHEPGSSTFAEWRSDEAGVATLNGRPAEIDNGRILLNDLQPDNELEVNGRGEYSTSGEGLHRAVDPADGAVYTYSMCFLHEASRVFACFDQPDLKATMRLQVTGPESWTVVSNAPREPGSEWKFTKTPRLPPYLLAVAAGPYASVHSSWTPSDGAADLPLGLYCRQSLVEHLAPDELFDITKAGLEFFTKTFDTALPFPKYDQLFAPEFNAGAMENPGLVIHRDELLYRSAVTVDQLELRAVIILHEMAHMWFGDYVSMRWWEDLWLNEAFAEFCGYLATAEVTRYNQAWTSFCVHEKSAARMADIRPSSHPVSSPVDDTDQALLNFDAISYNKGASLLKQFVAYVGREQFFAGIHDYFDRYAWGNTDFADLLAMLQRSSGRAVATWGEEHVRSSGVPSLLAARSPTAPGASPELSITRSGPHGEQRVGVATYRLNGGRLVRDQYDEVDLSAEVTSLRLSDGVFDLALVNEGDLAYARTELDPGSLATLLEAGVNALDDSLTRAIAWGALWDMVQQAQFTVADFMGLVTRAIPCEEHPEVLAWILKRSDYSTLYYTSAVTGASLRSQLADACTESLSAVAPGSGRQLALVRAHTTFATTPGQLGIVMDRIDGPAVQTGLPVDADLRWSMLIRLVTAGLRTAPDIDNELERDPTAFGQHKAQEARAAIPDASAKERGWQVASAVEPTTNRLVAAACRGFWQLGQVELCAPYAARYFGELERVWRECDVEVAHIVTDTLFPAIVVGSETLALVEGHLTRPDLPHGQQRSLRDSRFDMEMAIKIRRATAALAE